MPANDTLSGSDAAFRDLLNALLAGLPTPDPELAAAADAWHAARQTAATAQSAANAAFAAKRTARQAAMRRARLRIRIVQADPAIPAGARAGTAMAARSREEAPRTRAADRFPLAATYRSRSFAASANPFQAVWRVQLTDTRNGIVTASFVDTPTKPVLGSAPKVPNP